MEEMSAIQDYRVRFVQLPLRPLLCLCRSRLTPIFDPLAATLLIPCIIKRKRAGASSVVRIWLVSLGSGNRRGWGDWRGGIYVPSPLSLLSSPCTCRMTPEKVIGFHIKRSDKGRCNE